MNEAHIENAKARYTIKSSSNQVNLHSSQFYISFKAKRIKKYGTNGEDVWTQVKVLGTQSQREKTSSSE